MNERVAVRFNLAIDGWEVWAPYTRKWEAMSFEDNEWGCDGNAIDEAARLTRCDPESVRVLGDHTPGFIEADV